MSRFQILSSFFSVGLLLVGSVAAVRAAENTPAIRWQTDYVRAHELRVEHKMPMLVVLTSDNCPHCHRMLETTYADRHVVGKVSQSFVPMVINGTHQQELAEAFRVRIYPTTYIVGADNRILDRIEGYVAADVLQQRLGEVSRRQTSVTMAETTARR